MSIEIGGRTIGSGHEPFIIAEMSGNHNGELDRALAIVDAAADAGSHGFKIQTYTADTLTIDVDLPDFRVTGDHELWGGRNLYSLYKQAHTPWEWHQAIFDRARAVGMVPFSTPFDPTSVEFLEALGIDLYKTASAEIVDLPLMREIARTGKPMLISTGMATLSEIDAAVNAARSAGCSELVLLACTAAYPAAPEDGRLHNIAVLREAFGVPVGLSDHTRGIGVAIAAVALGAVAVEKHFTLNRHDGGVDSAFSLDPAELRALITECRAAALAVGRPVEFGPTPDEESVLRLRRSLYVVADVAEGDVISPDNVRSIRPSGGLTPDDFALVEGRRFRQAVKRGTPLRWDLL